MFREILNSPSHYWDARHKWVNNDNNHVTAVNQRKHSIVLKSAKEARLNGVLHVKIFA